MKTIACRIKGLSGLLMNRFPMTPIENPPMEKRTREEQAALTAYRDEKGMLFIPGVAIQRAMINSATYSKGKGRASLQKIAAACIFIRPDQIDLGTKEYEIDSRPVVNPTTKGRIIKHRARLNEWQAEFSIDFDESLLTEKQVRQIVDDAGSRVGILDFRPEKKGPFGRFIVVKWE